MSGIGGGTFQVTLAAAGTSQAVRPAEKALPQMSSCIIRAMSANTGTIYIGNDGTGKVSATTGFELAPGDALAADTLALSGVFLNGTKTGDKICVIWVGP